VKKQEHKKLDRRLIRLIALSHKYRVGTNKQSIGKFVEGVCMATIDGGGAARGLER